MSSQAEIREKYQQALRECPAAFYTPNKPAPEAYILSNGGLPGTKSEGDRRWFESDARLRCSIGGNRAGKTTKLILEAGAFCVGFRPWYPPSSPWHTRGLKRKYHPGLRVTHGEAVRVRYVVPNFGVHMSEVMKELRKWWPQSWWKVSGKNDRGVPSEVTWFNGSVLIFMSHHQDTSDFEGVESDAIFWDEPPPQSIWVALERSIVSTSGRSHVGATLLDASGWFWDEVVSQEGENPDILITWHSIWDNTAENGGCPSQFAENVRLWLSKISDPEERLAREHGSPMHIGGLVLSSFDATLNVCDPFELPKDAQIVAGLDPAGSRPFAGLHVAYIFKEVKGEPTWEAHVFDETWIPATARDLGGFCEIWKMKERGEMEPFHPKQSALTIIDPFANEIQKADRWGRTLRTILSEDYGIWTVEANRQGKRARLMQLNARVKERRYFVWSTCKRLLMERRRWTWDPQSPKLTKGPDDLSDCWTYIDSMDPPRILRKDPGEEQFGVWIPDQYRQEDPNDPFSQLRYKDDYRQFKRF